LLNKRKAEVGSRARAINLIRNWLHQGFIYLDFTEMIARCFLEIGTTALLAWVITKALGSFEWNLHVVIFSAITIHTLNWLLNGNWWACVLFAFPGLKNPGESATCRYLNEMRERLKKSPSISGVLIFGSLSRGKWHERSDIDLRILRKPGLWNAICAIFIQIRERVIALFSKQPLDMYLADDVDFLMKMRKDEQPIFLLKRDSRLESAYPSGREIRLERLR